jgi:inosine-uridine nucleoside N-ribohydrolase
MRFKFWFLSAVLSSFLQTAGARAIWIDTDPSIGLPFGEADDAFALVLAFHCAELKIAGISTTYGNASLNQTTQVACDLVNRFGAVAGLRASDVYSGASTPRDLGRATPATEALASALRQDRHVTYVALGPLTNLATFLKVYPNLADHIDQIIFVGGKSPEATHRFGPNKWLHIHDANVVKDPAAVQVVLHSKIPLRLVPVETSFELSLDDADLHDIASASSAGDYLYRKSRAWLWFWRQLVKAKGGSIFDALAICMLRPELVVAEKRYADMDPFGNLIAGAQFRPGARPVRFCTMLRPATKRFVLQRLQGGARR